MKTFTQNQLNEILKNHKLWLQDNSQGARADLSNTDLSNIDLRDTNLKKANPKTIDILVIKLRKSLT